MKWVIYKKYLCSPCVSSSCFQLYTVIENFLYNLFFLWKAVLSTSASRKIHSFKLSGSTYQKVSILWIYQRNGLVWTLVEDFYDVWERGRVWNCSFYEWQYWVWVIKVFVWSVYCYYEMHAYTYLRQISKRMVGIVFTPEKKNIFDS